MSTVTRSLPAALARPVTPTAGERALLALASFMSALAHARMQARARRALEEPMRRRAREAASRPEAEARMHLWPR